MEFALGEAQDGDHIERKVGKFGMVVESQKMVIFEAFHTQNR